MTEPTMSEDEQRTALTVLGAIEGDWVTVDTEKGRIVIDGRYHVTPELAQAFDALLDKAGALRDEEKAREERKP